MPLQAKPERHLYWHVTTAQLRGQAFLYDGRRSFSNWHRCQRMQLFRREVYEELEEILAYMGADALLADELNAFRAAVVRKAEEKTPQTNRKATFLFTENLSDKFSDKMWLRPDNYP